MKVPEEEVFGVLQGNEPQGGMQGRKKVRSSNSVNETDSFSRFQQTGESDRGIENLDPERAKKLESLKERISRGTYNPDLRDVATSLIDFLLRTYS